MAYSSRCLLGLCCAALGWGGANAAEVGKIVQAMGEAYVAGAPARVGDSFQEGATLKTGANGYLYIKTTDNGFFILRPNTTARVPTYQVDASQPQLSRFKIELTSGVLRSISGQAVKQARQNYRLNTPLAAIGVRGTDFTVYTTDQVTRVAVTSGGVVVSGYGAGCAADGQGPCETEGRQELFANQPGQILQVVPGSMAPQRLRDATLAPDAVAPARADEPVARLNASPAAADLTPLKNSTLALITATPEPPPALVWGRWQALAAQGADFSLPQAMANGRLVALSSYFALLSGPTAGWRQPQEATANFTLQAAQAQVLNPATGQGVLASLDNATLSLDFANNRFATSFELVTPDLRVAQRAQGNVAPDGTFGNARPNLGSNMTVTGVLSNTTSLQAGYLFQSRLDATRLASGVTYWTK
ncbi:MAG: FecR family protein [Polaromonas sp.]|nr:FecR family protein [Polaromonas sp.]